MSVADEMSPEERELINKLLAHPEEFPPEFRNWILNYLGQNIPPLPVEHFQGYKVLLVREAAPVVTAQSTTSATYVDLATVGPELTKLPDGRYIVFFGCNVDSDLAGDWGKISLSINGAAPSDAHELFVDPIPDAEIPGINVVETDPISNNNNNSIKMQYKSAGAPGTQFSLRWMIAVRTG